MNTIRLNSTALNAVTISSIPLAVGEIIKKPIIPVVPDEPIVPDEPEPLPLGVFIQHVDGSLYTADEWTAKGFASADANGVAVSAEECKFVVAKNCPDWGVINGVIEGVTIAETAEEAIKDMNGISNTEAIVSVASYGAAVICANYTFPNGKKGYLGAAGEWQKVFENKVAFEEAYSVLGITTSFSSGVWTSTIRSDASYSGWKCNWNVGIQNAYKSDRIPVYPFTTL